MLSDNNIINVNNFNPQMIRQLVDKVDLLERMIYNYDAKGIVQGIIKGIKIQQVIKAEGATPEIILSESYVNDNGGLHTINDINGKLNVKIGSENGSGGNVGGTILLYNDGIENNRVGIGISHDYDGGIINLKNSSGTVTVAIYAASNLGAGVFVNGVALADKNWVNDAISDAIAQHVADYHSTP